MVYEGVQGEKREKWRAWIDEAERFLKCAEENCNEFHECSDILAKHAVELALKGLIISKKGELPEQFSKGRVGHDIIALKEYLVNKGMINGDEIPSVTIGGVAHTDIAFNEQHYVDCISGMIAHEKYPFNGVAPRDFLTVDEVEDLIEKCSSVIEVVKSHLTND